MAVMHWSTTLPQLQARYIPDTVYPSTPWKTAPVWLDENNVPAP
ncbi:MAG: hypothetical protein ABL974_13300 [Prosthecobacter sp.]